MASTDFHRRAVGILLAVLMLVVVDRWASPAYSAPEQGLVLYLNAAMNSGQDFNPQATTWTDLSEEGNNGSLRNYDTPTWVGSGQTDDPHCLRFNGQGNYVEVADADSLDMTEAFTVEALVRIRQGTLKTEVMAPFLAKGSMGSIGDFNLQVRSGGKIGRVFLNTQIKGKTETLNTGPTIELADDTFAHFVFSYDINRDPRSQWYVNGETAGQHNQKCELVANDNPVVMGSHQAGKKHRLAGDIAFVRLYNRALTADEVEQNHREAVALVPNVAQPVKVVRKVQQTQQPAGLSYKEARICVTGYDTNRPDDFPGLGDFIGWVGGVVRLADGDLLFVHSAGYWHVSFATPHVITDNLKESYSKSGFAPNHQAPTGGRIMAVRSTDNGKTWSRPVTVYDGPLDDGCSNVFVTDRGTVLVFVNMQASWYGLSEAPEGHQELNTRQLVMRSTDNGQTWTEPVPINSSGTFYTRSYSGCIQLPDGGILWMTYDMFKGRSLLDGTIHRSDDDGNTWRIISNIHRDGVHTDEGDLVRLSDGRILLVLRPDGGVIASDDDGVTWEEISKIGPDYVYAPRVAVLEDDTVVCTAGGSGGQSIFLSTDEGKTWSDPITVDPSVYGYGKLFLMEDESFLLGYVQSGGTPNRCWLTRFRVNDERNGIELLPIGE